MKTKTTDLINKFLTEELNQPPMQQVPVQQTPVQQPMQPQAAQKTQTDGQSSDSDKQEEQKVEVYLPLHDGRFTNRIFTTSKGVILKILDDSIDDDLDVMQELENNPNTYFQISV
jgi:hypothetical protein